MVSTSRVLKLIHRRFVFCFIIFACLFYSFLDFRLRLISSSWIQAPAGSGTLFMMEGVIAMPVGLSTATFINNLDTLQATLGVEISISDLPNLAYKLASSSLKASNWVIASILGCSYVVSYCWESWFSCFLPFMLEVPVIFALLFKSFFWQWAEAFLLATIQLEFAVFSIHVFFNIVSATLVRIYVDYNVLSVDSELAYRPNACYSALEHFTSFHLRLCLSTRLSGFMNRRFWKWLSLRNGMGVVFSFGTESASKLNSTTKLHVPIEVAPVSVVRYFISRRIGSGRWRW